MPSNASEIVPRETPKGFRRRGIRHVEYGMHRNFFGAGYKLAVLGLVPPPV